MKDSKKIIYLVVTIFTLIIVITGSTYAYFAITASNNNAVTGSTANVGLTLVVNKITPSGNTTDYLVPQLENYLETAINSPYNCIDDNNNTVCQVYKATLTNTGSATEKVKGTITFSGINNMPNLKWKMITDATTIGSNTANTASVTSTIFVGDTTLNASQSIDYYFVVWIDETGSEQTDRGTYSGSITFTAADGRGVTSTIDGTRSLYATMIENAELDSTSSTYVSSSSGINFDKTNSDANGKGVYIRAGTENDAHPIYYFRGDIDNNNVIFANMCFKMVRTTDTGGIKMIYNGVPTAVYEQVPLSQSDYTMSTNTGNFTWNSTDSTWNATITDGQNKEISFTVPAGDGYKFKMTGTTGSSTGGSYYIYKDGTQVYSNGGGGGGTFAYTHDFGTLTTSNVVKFAYQGSSTVESPITFKIKMLRSGEKITDNGCNNTGTNTQIGTKAFNTNSSSLADVGYMYGTRYAYAYGTGTGWYYAPDVTYANGTYTLTSKGSYSVETKSTISGTNLSYQHYTCGSSTGTTCTSVRYVYYVSGRIAYYISLTNGKKIEDALSDMLDYNTTSSTIKGNNSTSGTLDYWYYNNIESVNDSKGNSYSTYIEDTIYCNDRSIYSYGGWNPDGGSTTTGLYFGAYGRTTNPIVTCPRNIDKFTVSSSKGNGNLDYPVGLLTEDEIRMAGAKLSTPNYNYYLYNGPRGSSGGTNWWSASPFDFYYYGIANEFLVDTSGTLPGNAVNNSNVVRPSVSLSAGTRISDGDGSSNNPYLIKEG